MLASFRSFIRLMWCRKSLASVETIPGVAMDPGVAPGRSEEKLYYKEVTNFKGRAPVLDPNRGDLHEDFEIGQEELVPNENDEKRVSDDVIAGANGPQRHTVQTRVMPCHAAVGVGKVLFRPFALALDLPETYFGDNVWPFP
ncbi:hypothetical protein EDD17DRAFT_1764728 [Pisolithus thermaeus]|nr:hypothetical protein EDD17DRAFT_1764728 [Pisolithus thermaeus]